MIYFILFLLCGNKFLNKVGNCEFINCNIVMVIVMKIMVDNII